SITEATDLYRTLTNDNPAAHLPNLAMSLNNLASRLAETGDQQGALTTITEATDLYRTLTNDNPAAHLPNLAMSLNNLAAFQAETGDQQGALTTITEATDLYRTLTNDNPAAHLPSLAGSLNNLATAQAETGDQQGALSTITEATDLYRTLTNDNPAAHLPDLAMSLNNLASRLAETGDRQGALTTITEATDLYRTLTNDNPVAYLPKLAASLNGLARIATPQEALAAYSRVEDDFVVAHPSAVRRLAVQRAQLEMAHGAPGTGLRTLVSLTREPVAAHTPDPAAFNARWLLRRYGEADPARASEVADIWREATGAAPPPWLALPRAALDLAVEWINCPTWAASRAFWDKHPEELRSTETVLALEELTLISQAAGQHLRIVRDAKSTDADRAFLPYLTGELLSTWTGLASWEESRAYLAEHATALLHEQALVFLGSDLESPDSAVHFALIVLARAYGIPEAFTYVENRAALHDRLQLLLAAPDPDADLLLALALLERFSYGDVFTGAAHIALASALKGAPSPTAALPPSAPADRDRVIAEIAALIGRHPQHAAALSSLIQQILAGAADPASPA
ncbi:hypothetical protein ABZ607_35360, partial [Streptomyces sp. NPDC007369]